MVATRAYRRTPTAIRGRTASKHTDESDDVRAAHHAAVAPERSTPMQLLALQRTMGNSAATIAVQRRGKGKKAQDPFELGAGIAEQTGGVNTSVGGGLTPDTWTGPKAPEIDPLTGKVKVEAANTSDPGVQLGFVGSSFGTTQGLVGTIGSSMAYNTARKERNLAKRHGHQAGVRLQERNMRMAGGDIGKNVTTMVGGGVDLGAKGMQVTMAGTSQLANMSVAAGAFAAPLALFNMLRDVRKTAKAWARCSEIEKSFQSWDEPRATIEKMQAQFDEAEAGRVEAESKHAEAKTAKAKYEGFVAQDGAEILRLNREIGTLQRAVAPQPGALGKIKGVGQAIGRQAEIVKLKVELAIAEKRLDHHQAQVAEQTQKMTELETEVTAAVQVKADCLTRIETAKPLFEKMKAVVGATGEKAMGDSLKKATSGGNVTQPSLTEIAAYAWQKNHSGRIKKFMSAFGGALATGGAAAGLALSIAAVVGTASAIAMASPIGWTLAGLAAVVGVGLGLYKGFKWLTKRWRMAAVDPMTGTARTTGARLKKTLAVWVPAGVSRREKYAKRLLEMSMGDKCYSEQMDEARKLVGKLVGHDWSKLGLASLSLTPGPTPVTAPTAFAPGTGSAGTSTGINSGATTHEGIATNDLTQAQQATSPALPDTTKRNKNFKAAHELLIAKFAS